MKTSGRKTMTMTMTRSEKRRMAVGGHLVAKMVGTAHRMDSFPFQIKKQRMNVAQFVVNAV